MRRRWFLLLASATAGAIAVGSAAARPKITTDAAPGADFSSYKTFAWVNPRPPAGMDPVAFGRIRSAVESGLAAKGYQPGDPGDLSLILSVGARQKADLESWGRFGLQQSVYQYTEGTLSVDAFDTKTRQAVWHGQASETINPDKPNVKAVDAAVAELMSKFPPGGGSAPAAPAKP